MPPLARTRISAAPRKSSAHDPLDRERVDPLQIEIPKVEDPDPEVVEDPAVRVSLPAPGPDMPELVQQEPEEVALREMVDEGEGAHGVRVVEGVHQAPLADLPRVHLPEEDDLAAADLQLRPGELRLGLGDEVADEPERELEPAGRGPLTG